jgi:hypothetical protein
VIEYLVAYERMLAGGVRPFDEVAWRELVRRDVDPEPYPAAGATWWLAEFAADAVSVDRVHAVIRDGPIAHP